MTQLSLFLILIFFIKKSYDTQLVVSIIGKFEKNYSGHFEKINKMLAPVWISFFTGIFSFKMLTSSAWPITLNPPHTLHKVTGVLMCDYKEIMRVIRPVNFILVCGKKTANSSTLATYNRGLGLQFPKGKQKGFIKTHRPHTKSQRRESLRRNELSCSIYFPLNFIFSDNWAWVLTLDF